MVPASSDEASGVSRALLRYIHNHPQDNLQRDEFGQYIEKRRVPAKSKPKEQDELEGKVVEHPEKEEACLAQPGSDDGNGDEATKRGRAKKKKRKATQKGAQPVTGPA
jgi:hypothetical protein